MTGAKWVTLCVAVSGFLLGGLYWRIHRADTSSPSALTTQQSKSPVEPMLLQLRDVPSTEPFKQEALICDMPDGSFYITSQIDGSYMPADHLLHVVGDEATLIQGVTEIYNMLRFQDGVVVTAQSPKSQIATALFMVRGTSVELLCSDCDSLDIRVIQGRVYFTKCSHFRAEGTYVYDGKLVRPIKIVSPASSTQTSTNAAER